MKKQFLEAGKIVNTHGVQGEVKIVPWADSPAFLQEVPRIFIDEKAVKIRSARVHKQFLIAKLDGIENINDAIALKNKMVWISREDIQLPEGDFFIQDILGLPVIEEDGTHLGTLKEILPNPSDDIYVIADENGDERLIPDVPAFILEKNLAEGYIKVRLIEGL